MEFDKTIKNGRRSRSAFIIGCLLFLMGCVETSSKKSAPTTKSDKVHEKVSAVIIVKTFPGKNGWGYDIFRNGKQYIHQPSKPGLGGNQGFDTELQARKVGEFVAHKIKTGAIPPSVMEAELDSIVNRYKN